MGLTPIPQNYTRNVDWIIGAYLDAGVSFPNGFQKDAIQNAVGARKTNNWKNWKCDISYKENSNGKFVIISDSGTMGLTGKNTPAEEIIAMMAREETLPPEERLSRFTSMFNSGGNATGGGLYGAGKSVYSVASEDYTYYFDSLREDGIYVANVNKKGQVASVAYEGNEAKKFIFENTGLSEKTTVGTRIIIVSPKEELVNAINDGTIITDIQESWWIIIDRLKDDAAITVNGNKVTVPTNIKQSTRTYELPSPEKYLLGYKVKHFGLYVFDDGDNRWQGISYYRKGMKIGEIDLKDIPKKVDGKYWGYIEVDEQWEEELSDIEDKVHFGVSKGKKRMLQYQNLKNYTQNKVTTCLTEWGYIKDKESEDKKLKDELNQIKEDIQNLFKKLNFEDLGKGPKRADFDVRWQNIRYPEENSERVTGGDTINFSVRISSSYTVSKRFEYNLSVVNPQTGSVVSVIKKDKISIESGGVKKLDFEHQITKDNSVQFAENRILLSVKVRGSGKEKRKELPYFFDIDRPTNSREEVKLALHECIFPTENSRRVNFNEKLRNVTYLIDNKRNETLNYRLNISIHNASDITNPKIIDVTQLTGTLAPFEEIVTDPVKEIVFDKATYSKYLTDGVLELRARLIANEDDSQYEKGDKITFYHYKIFLNSDEKHGSTDSFDINLIKSPEDYRRSWNTPGNGRSITLNIGHAAYTNLENYADIQHDYLREQMLKQFVLLYLSEGRYDMFGDVGKDFVELEPQEAAEQVLQKIESVYYQSLKS